MNSQPDQKALHILLVDNSLREYTAIRRAFDTSEVAADITHERSAEPALQRVVREGDKYDVLVISCPLSGMNCLEFSREVIRLEIPIAVVILSGPGSQDFAAKALKAGIDDYLIKDPDRGYLKLLPVVLPEAVRRRNDRLVHKLAKETVAAGEERLRHILDALADGCWDWNVQTGGLFLSPRYFQSLGCQPDGLAASYWTWLDLLHPDDRDDLVARIDRRLQSRDDAWVEEFRIQAPAGYRWIRSSAVVVERTPDQRPLRVVGIILDITDHKTIGAENARLRRRLRTRVNELERFSRVIERQFQPPLLSLETFAAELASLIEEVRDLLENEPIDPAEKTRITSLLKTGAGSDVSYIDTAVKDMRRLLDGLAELIDVDQRPLNVETVEMDRLLDEVRAALGDLIEETRAQVDIESLPPCRGDYDWTRRIFTHLLTNALGNLDPYRPGRIAVSGAIEDEMAVYCVQDNGIGIAPERQQDLFDLLPPAPDAVKGRGLGLSIVARILDRLDGHIRLESEPGQGSRFYVSLPAVAVTVAQQGPKWDR